MPAMATNLTEFSDKENQRTYVLDSHSSLEPRLVIQKRRVPTGSQVVQEDTVTLLWTTTDSSGAVLPEKVSMEAKIKQPRTGDSADVTSALSIFKDLVLGDEFTTMVTTSKWLK